MVMARGWKAALLAVALSAAPVAAQQASTSSAADTALITAITGEDMTALLQEIGWSARLTDNDGKPLIIANYTDAESGASYDFQVGLYRCDETTKACFDVMFMRSMEASKPVTLKMVNHYNSIQMFGVAYLNDDGTLGQSMTQTIQGGVTRQNLKEMADWWKTILVGFDTKVTGG